MSGATNGRRCRRLRLELPATHREVRVARSLLRRFARLDGLDERELETLVLVASELLDNAVDHGGGGAAQDEGELPGEVCMRLALDLEDESWRLEVLDEGGGDPEALEQRVQGAAQPASLEDERGRGLFLIASLVDRLEIERSPDGRGVRVVAAREHGRQAARGG